MRFTNRRSFRGRTAFLLLVVAVPASADFARAAELVKWRGDYNSARREATEKSRPLFLDFGTEDCYHCRRLDATTFKDPAVGALLNDRFVPLKIDANREPMLAQMLRVNAYPTLILAANDGKILTVIEGYMEAPRLAEHLQRALATSAPDWMARDFQEASKAIGAADYARAVALLKSILEDGKDRPIQGKARQVLLEVEQQAASKLARVRQLDDRGHTAEAVEQLTYLLRVYAGTEVAADGAKLLTVLADKPEMRTAQRRARARDLLAQAREDYRANRFGPCLDQCEALAASYGDTPEGSEGVQLASAIKSDPERMVKVCEQANERLAGMYLTLAESWVTKGQPQQAALCLERVVKVCPGSMHAEKAQFRLAQLGGQSPTRQAEFKKP